jgi:hypothetical protein
MFLFSDDNFEIRQESLAILSRLAKHNPATILPELRQILLLLISQIRNSYDMRLKEEATRLLCSFFQAVPLRNIIKGFVGSLISSIVVPMSVMGSRLIRACLEAVGELCMVMREDIVCYIDGMLPMVIAHMQDSSHQSNQEVAIRTLGQLVTSTGLVIVPYLTYPNLLPKALEILRSSSTATPWSLRREVLRTIGLVGALEPHKYNLIQKHLQDTEAKNAEAKSRAEIKNVNAVAGGGSLVVSSEIRCAPDVTFGPAQFSSNQPQATRHSHLPQGSKINNETKSHIYQTEIGDYSAVLKEPVKVEEDTANSPAYKFMYSQSVKIARSVAAVDEAVRHTPASENYYPHVAINALMKILRDPNLSTHHPAVTQSLMLI